MRRVVVVLALLVSSVALPLSMSTGAGAATKPPRLTLHTVQMRINVHDSGHFVYHAYHAKPGSRVVLQRKVGSGAWTKFTQTPIPEGSTIGSFNVGPLNIPEHSKYRARLLNHGKVIKQTSVHDLFVYGTVTMATLCAKVLDATCVTGTRPVPDSANFGYVMTLPISAAGDPWTAAVHSAKTSCRSVTFRYLSALPSSTNTTKLELRQVGRAAQKHSSTADKVGTFTAKLTGNKWGMSVAQTDPQELLFLTGSASCWSVTGAA